MAPTGDAYNVDWTLATASNAHAATHRDWFVTYRPFKSKAYSTIGGSINVEGVGDVELRVKKPNRNAKPSYSIIRLEDVLYCPSAVCNQISLGCLVQFANYGYTLRADGGELIRDNVRIGIVDCPNIPKLRLSGQSPNQTSLDLHGFFCLSFTWPNEERARWERVKSGGLDRDESAGPDSPQGVPPYTDEEKQWLKANWRGEFKFLQAHQLKIHDEKDRAEGRRIVRAMMHDSNDGDSDDGDSEDEWASILTYTNGRGAKPIIPHADGHLADYHFSEPELIWIEENFGNSASFLVTYGLKCYNDEDCLEGKQLLQDLMSEE
jgi:hypothetical protein